MGEDGEELVTADGKRVAVVLSGGGANGAYEVGVLKALVSGKSHVTGNQPLDPDIIIGTSVGALNAAFLVSQWEQYGPGVAVGNLERFWMREMAGGVRDNGVFRLRGNPLELLDPGCYLPNPLNPFLRLLADGGFLAWEGLQRLVNFLQGARASTLERQLVQLVDISLLMDLSPLERTLRKIDYRAIQRSRKWLKVAATNWATGELRVFWNHDMSAEFGPLALRASAAVPGVFPPAELGAQPFVDGSVLMHTPLSLATHAGADIVHVIYLDPDVSSIPLPPIPQSYSTMQRIFQISWAASYNADVAAAARINHALNTVDQIRTKLPADERTAELLRGLVEGKKPTGGHRPFRRLTIHRYHPRDPLAGDVSLLNFDPDRVQRLIERGFQDALYHDDTESEDVFPNQEEEDLAKRLNPRRVIP
ncbi:MAG TPA: patatin-like phospholipase family protein [Thermoanaerobaculia bacterium]|nr:patatin-like phospholipase family protein [Thermoanaerobaculia bacterium]